jgi:hypothetical protein
MNSYKQIYAALFLIIISILVSNCASSKIISPLPISKEVTCIENISGKGYKYLAWGIGENNQEAEQDALKAALWSAMVGGGAGNCISLMNVSEREANKNFIEHFFSNEEEWSQYVRSTNQGRIDADKRLRLADDRIKLGVEVIVETKLLRETLEARGIIGGMRIKN